MKNRGSILVITLWIVAILSVFAIALGFRASIILRLASYQRDRLKAVYFANGTINKTINLLNKQTGLAYDTLDNCGIALGVNKAEEVFSQNWEEGRSEVKIGNSGTDGFVYGLTDEERKINLNKIGGLSSPADLYQELFSMGTNSAEDAAGLAVILQEWTSAAEENDKEEKRHFKNTELNRPEELLLVLDYFYRIERGLDKKEALNKAQEVYNKIKEIITVCGEGKVNINTASDAVLSILVNGANVGEDKVNSLIGELNNRPHTDMPVDPDNRLDLSKIISSIRIDSDNFKFNTHSSVGKVYKNITLIYGSQNGTGPKKIIYRHEN